MKATQKILQAIIVLLIVLTAFQACKKQNGEGASGTYNLKLNETTTIPTGGSEGTITVTGINDTRCPANAICITLGSAIVNVKINDKDGEKTLTLNLNDSTRPENDAIITTINDVRYFIKVTAVNPFPDTSNTSQPKTVTIVISKNKI